MTSPNETAKVAVVGAGNIGSRHLQALVKFDQPLEIHVVDPSPDALGRAAAGLGAVASNEHVSVCYLGELNSLPSTPRCGHRGNDVQGAQRGHRGHA